MTRQKPKGKKQGKATSYNNDDDDSDDQGGVKGKYMFACLACSCMLPFIHNNFSVVTHTSTTVTPLKPSPSSSYPL